ncbi:MAG: type II toxin-antitoxin system RelE/ParE family toxin [Opitutae bacterium]|nr:type II toxin-antitoxin system RelE/ParE family toxin [Opitutae bacterium]
MRFEFLLPAAAEFQEAIGWYERRSIRAAEGFRSRVRAAILTALARPTSAGYPISARVRKIRLRPYDYGLLYFVQAEVLYVVAIAHNKRRPHYWQSRLE